MKIYVAAPYPLLEQARWLRERLLSRGHVVTSRWLVEAQDEGDDQRYAIQALQDIERSDIVIVLHPETWHEGGTGGRHVELGYALALGKQIFLLGRPTNVFHHLTSVRCIARLEEIE